MTDPIPLRSETTTPLPVQALRCPNMLAVASGKGGVGKTWFSITLCQSLAQAGKRVLLFDGDLGLANVDIQLGLTPDKDLADVMDGDVSLANAVARSLEGGFDILAGRSGSGNLASIPSQKLSDLRAQLIALAPQYDVVVVDLGAGVDRAMRQMAGPAALTYVVVTDEPTSITDAYAFIKLSHAANPDMQMRIVINMATSAHEGKRTYETIRKACDGFLGFSPKLAGVVRRDARVRDAIRAQMPLLSRSPQSDAGSDVAAIARYLSFTEDR